MTTPSGRPAVAASRLGHEYQDLIAWQHALHAAHPNSTATAFEIESPTGVTYDDVAVIDPRRSTYVQAKLVVDAPGGFTLEWLLEPQGTGKSPESMAQKALRTYRRLRETGPVDLNLYTTRELALNDRLGVLRDPRTHTLGHVARRLLSGEHKDQNLLEVVTQLQTHLGCDQAELLELLGSWKLQWAYGMPEAVRIAQLQMQAYGLRDDDEALRAGTAFVGGLLNLGERTINIADLRAGIAKLELESGRHCRTLSVAAIDVEHNAVTAQVAIDLQHLFEGRTQEQARGLDDWTEFDHALVMAVEDLGSPQDAPVLVHASVRLPTWFRLGTLMRTTMGWTVGCQLGSDLFFSDGGTTHRDLLQPSEVVEGVNDLVVTVNVTHDVRDVVTSRLSQLDLNRCTRLDIAVSKPGHQALVGPAAARRMVEEVKQPVMAALETTGAGHVHLFLACPKPIALLLGHQWHRLAPVTVYEDLGPGKGYQAAFTVCG